MIHSSSRSYNDALAGVGLLNHPQRVSKVCNGAPATLGWAFRRVSESSNSAAIIAPAFIGLMCKSVLSISLAKKISLSFKILLYVFTVNEFAFQRPPDARVARIVAIVAHDIVTGL